MADSIGVGGSIGPTFESPALLGQFPLGKAQKAAVLSTEEYILVDTEVETVEV